MTTATEVDIDTEVDISAEVPCEGVRYFDVGTDGTETFWRDGCGNPAAWSRRGHCSRDSAYCTPCKELVTEWARHAWVSCAECGTVLFPQDLNWFRL